MGKITENRGIPTEAEAFKRWADRECVRWPADLQRKAYHAWSDLELGIKDLACADSGTL